MRSWYPIPASDLDDNRLRDEHRELHMMYNAIVNGHKRYANHPETNRWRDYLDALKLRHDEITDEMLERNMKPMSPIYRTIRFPVVFPNMIEPLHITQQRLNEKQKKPPSRRACSVRAFT